METLVETQIEVAKTEVSQAPTAPATEGVKAQEAASSSTEQKPWAGSRNENGLASMGYGVEYEGWARTGLSIRSELEKNEESIAWQAAKWLVDGYRTFLGPKASNQQKGRMTNEAMKLSGLSRHTLIAYSKVGFAFPDGPVVPELGLTHHRAVILIPDRDTRIHWLRQAAKKKMTVARLKKAIKKLIPVKPKLGIKPTLEAKHYGRRLQNLNPKDHIWDSIMSDIQGLT